MPQKNLRNTDYAFDTIIPGFCIDARLNRNIGGISTSLAQQSKANLERNQKDSSTTRPNRTLAASPSYGVERHAWRSLR